MGGSLTGSLRLLPVQNIDFQTTILSRFDMIFIVKDEHNEARDKARDSLALKTPFSARLITRHTRHS